MVALANIKSSFLEELHLDALPRAAKGAFARCTSLTFFSSGGWYLAGGTALALQTGHRQSVDLDFFTVEKTFDEKKVAEQINQEEMSWKTTSLSRGTIYGEFKGAKMSLIAYPFFQPAKPMRQAGTVSLLALADIAAMKIVAISQRGRKRDFVDLYWLCQHVQPLLESINGAQDQYTVRQNPSHLIKSLIYFADAEDDPMPEIFFQATWAEVKKFFRTEIKKIAIDLLGLN